MKLRPAFIITTLGLLLSAANALASPGHKKDSIGQPGDSQAVDRTIEVRMGDIESPRVSWRPFRLSQAAMA